MQIDNNTVDKIASLSKLAFDGDEKAAITADMNRMLEFISKLEEIDTEGVTPLIHMTDEVNVLRADTAISETTQQEALKNAPKKDSTYIKIPKVVSK